jgi:outer membrane protein assembly factor BamB
MKTAFARHVMTPILHGNRVVVGSHQTGMVALDLRPGTDGWVVHEAWKNNDAAPNFSCPVAVGRHIIGLGPSRDVVSIDADNGATLWKQAGWVSSAADKAHAGFVVLPDDSLLVLTDSGEIIHFRDEGGTCRELGRAQVCGANWCNPALAGTRLYLRDGMKSGGTWRCIELGSE